jgi:hypothetical protein
MFNGALKLAIFSLFSTVRIFFFNLSLENEAIMGLTCCSPISATTFMGKKDRIE